MGMGQSESEDCCPLFLLHKALLTWNWYVLVDYKVLHSWMGERHLCISQTTTNINTLRWPKQIEESVYFLGGITATNCESLLSRFVPHILVWKATIVGSCTSRSQAPMYPTSVCDFSPQIEFWYFTSAMSGICFSISRMVSARMLLYHTACSCGYLNLKNVFNFASEIQADRSLSWIWP